MVDPWLTAGGAISIGQIGVRMWSTSGQYVEIKTDPCLPVVKREN